MLGRSSLVIAVDSIWVLVNGAVWSGFEARRRR
jgi:hypothetical protein